MNTSELTPSDKPDDKTGQKNCSNCGREFQCGAAARAATGSADFSCWCEELPAVGVVAAADQDCLCPECLREAIGKLAEKQVSVDN